MQESPLGERLKQAREVAGLSARGLSVLADLAASHVGLIENGKYPGVSTTVISALAEVLGASLDWLVDGKGECPPPEAAFAAVEAARAKLAAKKSANSAPVPPTAA